MSFREGEGSHIYRMLLADEPPFSCVVGTHRCAHNTMWLPGNGHLLWNDTVQWRAPIFSLVRVESSYVHVEEERSVQVVLPFRSR